MKKLLFALLFLASPVFAQTQTQYYTVPTIAALKAMTTSRPAVVQVVDSNPGIFNLSAGACSAADDIFQVQPTGGTTVCYTRAATPYFVGKSATANGVLVTSGTGVPSISSTLPAVSASATTAVATGTTTARSLALRFATTYNVKDFGALGDGSTNDAAAFNAAFTACEAATYGCEIEIPSGAYVLASKITKSMTKAVSIRGQGRGNTILLWTAADGGFALTYSSQYLAPKISDLSIRTTSTSGGGTAISITMSPAAATANDIGPEIHSVDIRGSTTTTDYWTNGITLTDVWYPVLSNFAIKGKDEAVLPFSMTSGITFTRTQVLLAHHFSMQHMEDAVLQGGTTLGEGLNLSQFELVGVRRGINLTSWAAGAYAIDGIYNGHINSYEYGIKTNYVVQAYYGGLLLYKTHISASNYVAIDLTNSSNARVVGNHMEDSTTATGTYTAVVLTTSSDNVVSNNTFDYAAAASTAINISTSSTGNSVTGNTSGNRGLAGINTVVIAAGAGTGNSVRGNLSSGASGLMNNSTGLQYISGNYPSSGTIEYVYTSANSLQIPSVLRNNNAGSPTVAIGFNVAASAAGDTSVSKGGIGFTRNGAQGQGYGALYNQGTGAATDFTTANEILRWTGTGVAITGTTTISSTTSIGKTTAPAAGILGIKAGTDQNIEVRAGISDATAIAINAVNDAGSVGVPLELLGSRITVSAALRYGGVDLSNSVTGTGSMVLSESPTFTGTLTALVTATGSTTARSLATRFAEVINVKDYGAVCDGTTVDTTAIQAALNAVPTGGAEVVFPTGFCRTGPLTLSNKTSFKISGKGRQTTTLLLNSAGTLLTISGSTMGVISDLSFEVYGGAHAILATYGLTLSGGSANIHIDRINVAGFAEDGLSLNGTTPSPLSGNKVSNSFFLGNRKRQLRCYENNDFHFWNNQFGNLGSITEADIGASLDACSAGTYYGNYHWTNVIGFKAINSNYNKYVFNRSEINLHEGYWIENDIKSQFQNNSAYSNSETASGTYDNLYVTGTDKLVVEGNNFFTWSATLARYGMNFFGTNTELTLADNKISGSATASYLFSGGTAVTGNYVDSASGSLISRVAGTLTSTVTTSGGTTFSGNIVAANITGTEALNVGANAVLVHRIKAANDTGLLIYSDGAGAMNFEAAQASNEAIKQTIYFNKYGGGSLFGSTVGIAGALTYGGVTLANSVTGTGSMVLSASPTFTGTLTATAGVFSATVGTGGYTVAALPAAPGTGARAYVTNQLTTCAVTGAALTGGGAVTCPVFYNGTAWVGG